MDVASKGTDFGTKDLIDCTASQDLFMLNSTELRKPDDGAVLHVVTCLAICVAPNDWIRVRWLLARLSSVDTVERSLPADLRLAPRRSFFMTNAQAMNVTPQDSPLLEVGWIVAGKLEDIDQRAVQEARESVVDFFHRHFPNIQFRMPMIYRDELVNGLREEPVVLLDLGVTERNIKHWDYTIVVTGSDLIGHYKTDALAAISRTFESAVISTVRIDPRISRQSSTLR